MWTTYFCDSSYITSCGMISLWNIFKNYGNNDFDSYVDLGLDYCAKTGYTSSLYASAPQINIYCLFSGIHRTYGTTGYMTFTDVQTMVQTNHMYGLAFSHNNDSSSSVGHVTAIVGYAGSASSCFYIFFNPHGSGTGLINVDTTTKQYTYNGNLYTWSDGYISNINISSFY